MEVERRRSCAPYSDFRSRSGSHAPGGRVTASCTPHNGTTAYATLGGRGRRRRGT